MSFQELVDLTRRHLIEEYSPQSFAWTDKDTYNYFRSLTDVPQPAPLQVAPVIVHQQPIAQPKVIHASPPKVDPKPKEVAPPAPPPKRQAAVQDEKQEYDFSAVRNALHEAAPHLKIVDLVPDDTLAKRAASAWKETLPEVILIGDDATPAQCELLKKISDAIVSLGYTSSLLTDIIWDQLLTAPHLKMVLMSQQSLQKNPDIQKKYRFDQARQRHYIDGMLLCPLPPLDKLQTDPAVKANLWQTIRQLLK